MPIYEYQCSHCGHRLEKLQKVGDAPLQHCPACEQDTLKKLLSAPTFRLKGGGWYETDFKADNRKRIAENGASDKAEGRQGAEAAGSGKPEGGKDAKPVKSEPSPAIAKTGAKDKTG